MPGVSRRYLAAEPAGGARARRDRRRARAASHVGSDNGTGELTSRAILHRPGKPQQNAFVAEMFVVGPGCWAFSSQRRSARAVCG